MQSAVVDFVLDVIRERGSALVRLARKGFGAICSLLGSATGLVRPLIKRAVSFVVAKVAPVAASARDKIRGALESLKRRAEAVLNGKADPLSSEVEEQEQEIAAPPRATPAAVAATVTETTTARTETTAATASPKVEDVGGYRGPASTGLAALAPTLGCAIVRALSRPRVPRLGRRVLATAAQ